MNICGSRFDIGDKVKTIITLESANDEELTKDSYGIVVRYPIYEQYKKSVWVYFSEINRELLLPDEYLELSQ